MGTILEIAPPFTPQDQLMEMSSLLCYYVITTVALALMLKDCEMALE